MLENEKNEIKKRSDAASDWASSENNLKKAETLLAELNRAEIKVQYESVEQKKREIQKKEDEINKIELIPVDDVNKAKKLEKEIKTILDRLRNFHAVIDFSVREGYELIVTSDVDGRLIDLGDGSIRISEAVKLEVPGVIELHLAAEEVDRVQMQADLKEKQDALQKLLQNYMAKDSSELEQMKNERSNTHNKLVNDLNSLQQERKTALSGKTEEELTEAYGKASVQPSRTKEEILEDAKSISGHPLSDCILLLKQTLKTYRESYESQEKNDEAIAQAKKKIEKYEKALEEAGNIPEEFQKISDPEKERDRRAKAKEAAEEKVRKAEIDYSAEKALLGDMEQAEDYQSLEELLGEIEDSKKEFERAKSDYQAWIEIKAVAEGILASVKGNPYQSLEDDFRDYLTRLTDGRIKVQSMDSLKPTVYSKDYKMSKDILSEGTKETIALAFRLAVFHFLYPDGGGFLVLDDPFTDMDEGRRVRSIDLVKEFGEKNQIIVTTCDGQVRDKLKGHLIKMEEYVSG